MGRYFREIEITSAPNMDSVLSIHTLCGGSEVGRVKKVIENCKNNGKLYIPMWVQNY